VRTRSGAPFIPREFYPTTVTIELAGIVIQNETPEIKNGGSGTCLDMTVLLGEGKRTGDLHRGRLCAFRLVRQLSEEGFLEERSGLRLVRTEELMERWLRASHYRAQETPARWILSGEKIVFMPHFGNM